MNSKRVTAAAVVASVVLAGARRAVLASTASPPPAIGVKGPLAGVGLLGLMLVILALVSWVLYRFARLIFAEPPDKG